MSEFLQKNKRKSLLALLLLLLRRGKGIGALAVMVLLLSGVFIAPNGFFIDMPFVRGFAEKLGLRSALGGEAGLRFRELAEALRNARANRRLAGGRGLFGARGGGVGLYGNKTGMDFVTGGDGYYGKGRKTYDDVGKGAGKSVDGVLSPEEAGKLANGVSLEEDELVDGLMNSAFAGGFADQGGPGGLFGDRMGLRDNPALAGMSGLRGYGGVNGNDGLDGAGGSDKMADAGSRANALKKARAVNTNTNLARAAYGHYARSGRGSFNTRGATRGGLSGFKASGATYSRAYGGGASITADNCFQGAPGIGPGVQKGSKNNGRAAGPGTAMSVSADSKAFEQNAQGCVLSQIAAAPAAANQGEFMSSVSGAVYDGNPIDAGGLEAPGSPTPMTTNMGDVGTLMDDASQLEEDARKCEEAEAEYGPQERRKMSEIQELSNEANAKCAGGGCKDNASACRRINNQMRQRCREYNSIAAQKAAACPLQDGFEAMDCNQ